MTRKPQGERYNPKTKTGWKKEGTSWVYYNKGKKLNSAQQTLSAANKIGKKFVKDQEKFWNPNKEKLRLKKQREKAGFPDKSVLDSKPSDTSKVSYERDSPQNLKKRFNREKDKTSDTGPFGGANPFKTKKKTPGEELATAPDLKLGIKYKDGKPSPETKKSQAKDTGGVSASDKAAWLHKTRNSPAAKAEGWKNDPDGRWELQKAVRLKRLEKEKLKIKNQNKKNGK